jgi:hypothetical protein
MLTKFMLRDIRRYIGTGKNTGKTEATEIGTKGVGLAVSE